MTPKPSNNQSETVNKGLQTGRRVPRSANNPPRPLGRYGVFDHHILLRFSEAYQQSRNQRLGGKCVTDPLLGGKCVADPLETSAWEVSVSPTPLSPTPFRVTRRPEPRVWKLIVLKQAPRHPPTRVWKLIVLKQAPRHPPGGTRPT